MSDEIYDYRETKCPTCGSYDTEYEQCWYCFGEGGFHECGEDCCCCADPEELNEECPECGGKGGYLTCRNCARLAREADAKGEK